MNFRLRYAFLFPGVNSSAELVPSPRAKARNGASHRWLGDYTEHKFNDKLHNENRSNDLSFLHVNIRSLSRNFDALSLFLNNIETKFSIIGRSETWLQHSDWLICHRIEINRRATRVGTFEVCVSTHVALRMFIMQVLASQLSFLANRNAEPVVPPLFWPVNCIKIGRHVALLSGPSVYVYSVDMSGYKFIHNHRLNRTGGGVGLYFSDDLNYKVRKDLNYNSDCAESLFIEIVKPRGKNMG